MSRKVYSFLCLSALTVISDCQLFIPSDDCLKHDVDQLENYVSKLNLRDKPASNSSIEIDCSAELPFGALKSDWVRLLLLRDAQSDGSFLREQLPRLFRILAIAYYQAEERYEGKHDTTIGSVAETSAFQLTGRDSLEASEVEEDNYESSSTNDVTSVTTSVQMQTPDYFTTPFDSVIENYTTTGRPTTMESGNLDNVTFNEPSTRLNSGSSESTSISGEETTEINEIHTEATFTEAREVETTSLLGAGHSLDRDETVETTEGERNSEVYWSSTPPEVSTAIADDEENEPITIGNFDASLSSVSETGATSGEENHSTTEHGDTRSMLTESDVQSTTPREFFGDSRNDILQAVKYKSISRISTNTVDRKTTNKLKRPPILRKAPARNDFWKYHVNTRRASTSVRPERTERSTRKSTKSRKRGSLNTDAEKNLRWFYRYEGQDDNNSIGNGQGAHVECGRGQ